MTLAGGRSASGVSRWGSTGASGCGWVDTAGAVGVRRWAVKDCPAHAPVRPEEVLLLVRGAREDGKLAGPSLMRRGAA